MRASLAFTSTTLNPQCRAITCANVVLPVPVCVWGGSNSQGMITTNTVWAQQHSQASWEGYLVLVIMRAPCCLHAAASLSA